MFANPLHIDFAGKQILDAEGQDGTFISSGDMYKNCSAMCESTKKGETEDKGYCRRPE